MPSTNDKVLPDAEGFREVYSMRHYHTHSVPLRELFDRVKNGPEFGPQFDYAYELVHDALTRSFGKEPSGFAMMISGKRLTGADAPRFVAMVHLLDSGGVENMHLLDNRVLSVVRFVTTVGQDISRDLPEWLREQIGLLKMRDSRDVLFFEEGDALTRSGRRFSSHILHIHLTCDQYNHLVAQAAPNKKAKP